MNDRDIERIAGRLGEHAAARINVERVAAGVVARLRSEDRRAPWWGRPGLLRMAAAVTLVAGAAAFGVNRWLDTGQAPATVAMTEPVTLQALSADELEEVLDSLALEGPPHELAVVGLQNLNAEQLTELLQRMEG